MFGEIPVFSLAAEMRSSVLVAILIRYHICYNLDMAYEPPVKYQSCFPYPLTIAPYPDHECGCSWVYAPDITRDKENPYCIKVRNGWCWTTQEREDNELHA